MRQTCQDKAQDLAAAHPAAMVFERHHVGPKFFPDGGVYRGQFSVKILVPQGDSTTETLLFTTDGTMPRVGSEMCESTLTIKP